MSMDHSVRQDIFFALKKIQNGGILAQKLLYRNAFRKDISRTNYPNFFKLFIHNIVNVRIVLRKEY